MLISTLIERGEVGIYKVGIGKPTTIKELADMIIKISGFNLKPTHVPPRVGYFRRSYANIKKAKHVGWRPQVDRRPRSESCLLVITAKRY